MEGTDIEFRGYMLRLDCVKKEIINSRYIQCTGEPQIHNLVWDISLIHVSNLVENKVSFYHVQNLRPGVFR